MGIGTWAARSLPAGDLRRRSCSWHRSIGLLKNFVIMS